MNYLRNAGRATSLPCWQYSSPASNSGEAAAPAMPPWLVVSPHCDDGVFSCGALLAAHPGSLLVTVFAGGPADYGVLTSWDRACGFAPGDDVMAARRDEDRHAAQVLGASVAWLPFLDSQYGCTPAMPQMVARLRDVIGSARPDAVAFPLGLFHSDHELTREAMLALVDEGLARRWTVYADVPYRRLPGVAARTQAALQKRGYQLRALRWSASADAYTLKRQAVACYVSQLRALAAPGRLGHVDAETTESYFDLQPCERTEHAS